MVVSYQNREVDTRKHSAFKSVRTCKRQLTLMFITMCDARSLTAKGWWKGASSSE